jgi:hypothetical protein
VGLEYWFHERRIDKDSYLSITFNFLQALIVSIGYMDAWIEPWTYCTNSIDQKNYYDQAILHVRCTLKIVHCIGNPAPQRDNGLFTIHST